MLLTVALGITSFLGFLLTRALIGEHLGCANSRVTWPESAVPQSPPVHWR